MVSYDKGQSVVLSSLITKIIHVFTSSLIIILKNVNNRAIYLIETSPQKEPKPLKKIFTVAFQKLSYHKRKVRRKFGEGKRRHEFAEWHVA